MDNTIIKNIKSFFLNSYLNTLPFIDPQIVKELQKTNQKYTTKTIKLLNDFLLFVTSNLVNTDSKNILKAKQAYQNNIINIVNNINEDRVVKIDLKTIDSFDHKYDFSKIINKIKVVDGVRAKKANDSFIFSAVKYAQAFSVKEVLDIYRLLTRIPCPSGQG